MRAILEFDIAGNNHFFKLRKIFHYPSLITERCRSVTKRFGIKNQVLQNYSKGNFTSKP